MAISAAIELQEMQKFAKFIVPPLIYYHPEYQSWFCPDGRRMHAFMQMIAEFGFDAETYATIMKYCDEFAETKIFEESQRVEIWKKIKEYITDYITTQVKMTPKDYFHQWVTQLDTLCMQTGRVWGQPYEVTYAYSHTQKDDTSEQPDVPITVYHTSPHHWAVRPEFRHLVTGIPKLISLSAIVCGFTLTIADDPTKWAQ